MDDPRKTETFMKWGDTEKWKTGKWYPLPVGYFGRDFKEYIINGYDIFELEADDGTGDIIPVGSVTTTFENALKICEEHNQCKML